MADEHSASESVRYVGYLRANRGEGSTSAKLKDLADAYIGYSILFGINAICLFPVGYLVAYAINEVANSILAFGIEVGVLLIFSALANIYVSRHGRAMGWSKTRIGLTSVVMGFNALFCCGIVGYAIAQNSIVQELKSKYGVQPGGFGIRKRDVMKRLAELEAEEQTPSPPPTKALDANTS